MRKIQLVLVVLAISGLAGNVYADDMGVELYAEYCAGCHGADKSGLLDYAGTLEAFSARMEGVTENMPDFAGFFDEDEVQALHTYLTAGSE